MCVTCNLARRTVPTKSDSVRANLLDLIFSLHDACVITFEFHWKQNSDIFYSSTVNLSNSKGNVGVLYVCEPSTVAGLLKAVLIFFDHQTKYSFILSNPTVLPIKRLQTDLSAYIMQYK